MQPVRSYQDLEVWSRSLDWVEQVYRLTAGWPSDERFGLTSQARRAVVSVSANIAEGAARRTTGEFLQFAGIAKGSLAEAETLLLLSKRLGYTTERQLADVSEHAGEIGRMLSGLMKSLEAKR